MAQQYLVSDTPEAPLRGAYEVTLTAAPGFTNGFLDNDLRVTFTRADGTQVTVDGFYDGGNTFKARAYLDSPGTWTWSSASANAGLGGKSGSFTVLSDANLPGKLRKSTQDPRQFVQDDGQWFLHIGDTGYRYINTNEPKWQAYIDQAAGVGFTKIRTWFGNVGSSSNGDIGYMFQSGTLNLQQLQTADARLIYALNNHPEVQMQLIPFGEDTAKLKAYASNDALVRAYASEVHARYGALPNVQWCLSNDRALAGDVTLRDAVGTLGADWAAAEGWGTLLTNHQARSETYSFVAASWSDIVTFENLDQVTGERILYYRGLGAQDPIINEEDRYETWRNPSYDRYYFRRMMWASLLSGGAATYGGGETWKQYAAGTTAGVQGYQDLNIAGLVQHGADDFKFIHKFFDDTGLTLINLTPDDALVGSNALKFKAIRGTDVLIAYLANPTGTSPGTDDVSSSTPSVSIGGSFNYDTWFGYWFDPRTGEWTQLGQLHNAGRTFIAPGAGDWLLLVSQQNIVPEPASLGLLAIAGGGMLLRRRR